jgi:DNA-binding NarL/FixJ family response regulator
MQSVLQDSRPRFGVIGGFPAAIEGIRFALGAVGISPVVEAGFPLNGDHLQGLLVYIGRQHQIDTIEFIRCDHPKLPVIASISDEKMCGAAIVAGATSVVLESAEVEHLADIIRAAVAGTPLISVELAMQLMDLSQAMRLEPAERILLDGLASGLTVSALACRVGYSDRHTHRLIKRLYQRLNADERASALSEARLRGLLA